MLSITSVQSTSAVYPRFCGLGRSIRRLAHSVNCDVGENSINLKTGHMARFADAAVVASSGDNAMPSISSCSDFDEAVDAMIQCTNCVLCMHLEQFKRAMICRNGGYIAKKVEAETDVTISVDDDTHICMIAPNRQKLSDAEEMLQSMTNELILTIFEVKPIIGLVVEILDRGVLVTLQPGGKKYIVPNSQLSTVKVNHPTAAGIKIGQKMVLQWLGRDCAGNVRLSRTEMESSRLSEFSKQVWKDKEWAPMTPATPHALDLFAGKLSAVAPDAISITVEEHQMLTDIIANVDYHLDLLKGMQLAIKIPGLTPTQLSEELHRGTEGISFVLDKMASSLPQSRDNFKPNVPILELMPLDEFMTVWLFYNGGVRASYLEKEKTVKVCVFGDNFLCFVASNAQSLSKAKEKLQKLELERNSLFMAKYYHGFLVGMVVEVLPFGVLLILQPGGKTHLVQNSDLSTVKVNHPTAAGIKTGQKMVLQWLGRDGSGNVRLSRKPLSGSAAPVTNNFRK